MSLEIFRFYEDENDLRVRDFHSILNKVEPLHNDHLRQGQKKVTIVERFKQETISGLSAKKSGRCGEMTVSGDSTVVPALFWRQNVMAVFILPRV